ncbi:MAG TPA: MMPL family transporter [Alphaproteobacteria bacterium]|nr:MMPL family transporter [Alphaproteobacteria bacterium]
MSILPVHAEIPEQYPRGGEILTERVYRQAGPFAALALAWWVERVRRLAWPIVIGALLVAIAGGVYTAGHLGMNTDNDALLSSELPYRKTVKEFEQAFPLLPGNLVVIVEGDSPDRAEDAANALVAKLGEDGALFQDIFFPTGDPFFQREGLLFLDIKELQDLSDRLAQAQPLLGTLVEDRSLRGLFGVLGEAAEGIRLGEVDPGLLVRPLDAIADAVAAQLASKPARLSWRDLMTGLPDRPSDRRQIILLKPRLDYKLLSPAAQAIKAIHETAAALNLDPAHGVRVGVTGAPALDEDDLRSVKNGAGLASLVSLGLVTVLVFLGLRSPRLVFATIATLLLSLVWTASFAALAIGYLNLISVAFAVLFIGVAVDFSIQFALRYKESVDQGAALGAGLRSAASGTGVAVSLAAICAAVGFFSFVPTDYVGLSQLGIIAGVGAFIGLFATLTLLPAIITLIPAKPGMRPNDDRNGNGVTSFLDRHARAVCWGALALGLVSLAAFPFARFDIDPINLKNPHTESVRTYLEMTKDSSISPYSINIVAPSLAEADTLAKRLDRLPEVDSTVTLSSFIPQEQEKKLALIDQTATFLTPVLQEREPKAPPSDAERRTAAEDLKGRLEELAASPKAGAASASAERLAGLLARFADGPGQKAEAYSRLETALVGNLPGRLDSLLELMQAGPVSYGTLPPSLKERYLAADGRARIEVFPAENLTNESALRRFVDAVRRVAPNATDAPVELLEGGRLVVGAFEKAGAVAFVAIGVLLIVVLRSLRDSLLVLLPLVLAASLTVALVVLTGQAFNFANIIALPLLFSLGVAFGIYLVLRHRETPRVADLLRTSTPRAVLFSALTTMVSFSSLMVSSHRGTASMGYLLGICLSLALLCTLVVLPALLTWREQVRRRRHSVPR